MTAMPLATEAALLVLRMKYNAAYAAHQGRVRALTEAAMSGEVASHTLIESEAAALRALTEARENLLAGMRESDEPPT